MASQATTTAAKKKKGWLSHVRKLRTERNGIFRASGTVSIAASSSDDDSSSDEDLVMMNGTVYHTGYDEEDDPSWVKDENLRPRKYSSQSSTSTHKKSKSTATSNGAAKDATATSMTTASPFGSSSSGLSITRTVKNVKKKKKTATKKNEKTKKFGSVRRKGKDDGENDKSKSDSKKESDDDNDTDFGNDADDDDNLNCTGNMGNSQGQVEVRVRSIKKKKKSDKKNSKNKKNKKNDNKSKSSSRSSDTVKTKTTTKKKSRSNRSSRGVGSGIERITAERLLAAESTGGVACRVREMTFEVVPPEESPFDPEYWQGYGQEAWKETGPFLDDVDEDEDDDDDDDEDSDDEEYGAELYEDDDHENPEDTYQEKEITQRLSRGYRGSGIKGVKGFSCANVNKGKEVSPDEADAACWDETGDGFDGDAHAGANAEWEQSAQHINIVYTPRGSRQYDSSELNVGSQYVNSVTLHYSYGDLPSVEPVVVEQLIGQPPIQIEKVELHTAPSTPKSAREQRRRPSSLKNTEIPPKKVPTRAHPGYLKRATSSPVLQHDMRAQHIHVHHHIHYHPATTPLVTPESSPKAERKTSKGKTNGRGSAKASKRSRSSSKSKSSKQSSVVVVVDEAVASEILTSSTKVITRNQDGEIEDEDQEEKETVEVTKSRKGSIGVLRRIFGKKEEDAARNASAGVK